MTRGGARIRTPDQRLRVFVSSTLAELSAERRAVRAAIERLLLAPVMFELGARPHPPRELYRAYLEQSEVFVGLYWERYGWVAPGEDVSGLEDEYLLSGALPKLIYIKPSREREPRLTELLDRIRSDDTASYKSFETADELGELVSGDLAVLLAERFDQSRFGTSRALGGTPTSSIPVVNESTPLPTPPTELIGRGAEVDAVTKMVNEGRRVVTLTGPGGIGKSRIALEVAGHLATDSREVAFVDLAPVQDPSLVPGAIAQAIGVRDTGEIPVLDRLTAALRHRRMLLVLDNFEQVIDAAPMLATLLAAAPQVTCLVTSRALLRIAAERSFEVGPLALPDDRDATVMVPLAEVPAVALFVERARAVKPDFQLDAGNADAVRRICAALDGVPLAIELAAARIRVLPPAAMLARLDEQLTLLVGGPRDSPARQRTLRGTIEWSTELLDDEERRMLAALGVFSGPFTLEAVESLVLADGGDPLAVLGELVDVSLVRQHDRGGRATFSMLETVREYAREQLHDAGELDAAGRRHADYYLSLAARAEPELKGREQRAWVERLTDDQDNLRSALLYLMDHRDWDGAARLAWRLYMFWWVGGLLGQMRGWMERVLGTDDPIDDESRAIALYFTRAIGFWQASDDVIPGLSQSAELFEREHDRMGAGLSLLSLSLALLTASPPDVPRASDSLESSLGLFRAAGERWGEAMALVAIGRVAMMQQQLHAALNRFEESVELTRLQNDDLGAVIAENHLGWANLFLGSADTARTLFEQSLATSARLGHVEGVAYGLEALVAIAATAGDPERAGRLLGAAETLRAQSGLNFGGLQLEQSFVDGVRAGDGSVAFERGRGEGHLLGMAAALAYALPDPAASE